MIDEGYVKFRARWTHGAAPEDIAELVACRNHLHDLGLIGEYAEIKIGYGNVSARLPGKAGFVVSGSATGHIATATADHFCTVTAYDIAQNTVHCNGPVTASSESLTHAMLYACSTEIGAVLHIHHLRFWEHLLQAAPTTQAHIPYGTPEMALEMRRLYAQSDLPHRKILAMAGHTEGIIAFGPDIPQALQTLLHEFEQWKKNGKM